MEFSWRRQPALVVALLTLLLAAVIAGCSQRDEQTPDGVHDLVALFDLATTRQETARIDLGTPEGRVYLEQGWSWDESDEVTFAWGVGRQSTVRFFLTATRDLTVVLRGMPVTGPEEAPQRVSVTVNGTLAERLDLASGWREYPVALGADALVAGWNRLELGYSRWRPGPRIRQLAVRWDWLDIGVTTSAGGPHAASVDHEESTLTLPSGTELEYYLRLSAPATLHIEELLGGPEADPQLEVLIQAEGGKEASLGFLDPGQELQMALASQALGVSRLLLRTAGERSDDGIVLVRPRVVARQSEGGQLSDAASPPNVIIYLIDALRADRVGNRPNRPSVTPHIDVFATDSLAFPTAIAQSSWTKPAVASLFTGLLPPAHGVLLREHALAPQATTLAEALLAAGYRTAAFSTNPFVSRSFGLDQGFLDFAYLDAGRPGTHHAFSDEVNEHVAGWLDAAPSRPFLLYVHTIDPHAPYTPPRADGSLGSGEDPAPVPSCRPQKPLSEPARRHLVERYEEEVAFNDRSFGRFLAELRRRDLYDNSVIVLLSDHGEAFWEHQGWQHENFLYSEVIDIPLFIKPAGGGATTAFPIRLAQQIDVLPTILDLLGLPPATTAQGHSLLEGSPRGAAKAAFSYLECPSGKRLAAVIAGPWKLIRTTTANGTVARFELFDRRNDPGELADLAGTRPQIVERLARLLDARDAEPALTPTHGEIDSDLQTTLRALGYVD